MAEAYNIGMAARSMHRPLAITLSVVVVTLTRGVCRRSDAATVPEARHVETSAPSARRARTDAARPSRAGAAANHGADRAADGSDAWRVDLPWRGVRGILRRRTRPAVLPFRNQRQLPRHRRTTTRTTLKQKGELIYEEPPIHEFDIGRFREETMAFPPGVTVKDYTWGGSAGYLNPKRGATPARFKTIIQIVPATF